MGKGLRDFGVCYATSKDGIHWEKPELGLIGFEGSKENSTVIEGNHFDFESLKGRKITRHFELRESKLLSFSFK
jgi:hypothetical protein